MRTRNLPVLTLALLPALLAGAAAAEPADADSASVGRTAPSGLPAYVDGDPTWRLDRLWDDGNAEHCVYEATWARYGNHYRGRVLLITVKEPWAPDLEVKADEPRPDGFPVLKLNYLRDVPTGIYTYHQMVSLFLRRHSGQLQKLVATSSEACGISTALARGNRLETHSYFDGQGSREQLWPRDVLPEDGLPMLLRDYVVGEPPAALELFPSLLMGRFATLEPARWRLDRGEPETVDTPSGSNLARPFRIEREGEWQVWWLEVEAPHTAVRHERSDGTVYELAKCERIPYWEMHDPGDEDWLPESVR